MWSRRLPRPCGAADRGELQSRFARAPLQKICLSSFAGSRRTIQNRRSDDGWLPRHVFARSQNSAISIACTKASLTTLSHSRPASAHGRSDLAAGGVCYLDTESGSKMSFSHSPWLGETVSRVPSNRMSLRPKTCLRGQQGGDRARVAPKRSRGVCNRALRRKITVTLDVAPGNARLLLTAGGGNEIAHMPSR